MTGQVPSAGGDSPRKSRLARYARWTFLILIVALLIGAIGVYVASERALARDPGAPHHGISLVIPPPEDTAAIREGGRLAMIYRCRDCHGRDMSGKLFVDEPAFMVLGSPNLTTGRGASPTVFDPGAFERAVRHGVGHDGRNLVMMPAHEYTTLMSDRELASILAYARNVEAKARAPQPLKLGPVGRIAVAMDPLLTPARVMDHGAPHPGEKPDGVSREWGERFSLTCTSCHGQNLAGGTHPGAPEGTPWAPNITPGDEVMAGWDLGRFSLAMRAGLGSDGEQLDSWMPWPLWASLTDDEVESIWLHLRELEPLPDNPRNPPA